MQISPHLLTRTVQSSLGIMIHLTLMLRCCVSMLMQIETSSLTASMRCRTSVNNGKMLIWMDLVIIHQAHFLMIVRHPQEFPTSLSKVVMITSTMDLQIVSMDAILAKVVLCSTDTDVQITMRTDGRTTMALGRMETVSNRIGSKPRIRMEMVLGTITVLIVAMPSLVCQEQ